MERRGNLQDQEFCELKSHAVQVWYSLPLLVRISTVARLLRMRSRYDNADFCSDLFFEIYWQATLLS